MTFIVNSCSANTFIPVATVLLALITKLKLFSTAACLSNFPVISPEFTFIESPVGNDPDCKVYSKSPCRLSKSSTSIFIATWLSCLNVPRSEPVVKTGLRWALKSTLNLVPCI